MPLVMAHHDVNHLIERCKAGETLKNIADSIGACDRTVMEAFHRVGFRPLQWARAQSIQTCEPLHAAHMAGESLLSISQRTGIGRSTIIRAFKRLGLPWRDRSDGQRARMARLDADARRAHVAGANAAARVRDGGFWKRCERTPEGIAAWRPNDMVQAINNVASRMDPPKPPIGRPMFEVLKTADELAAEAQAADIASRNAAADEAERHARDQSFQDRMASEAAARRDAEYARQAAAEAQRQVDEGRRAYDATMAAQAAVLTPDIAIDANAVTETAATARNTKIDFMMYRLQAALELLPDYEQTTGIYIHSSALRRVVTEMLAKLEGNKV